MDNLTVSGEKQFLPNITQYSIRLPFRVAVVGQTDSGKIHSVICRWLSGKISFSKPKSDGLAIESDLQYCLYCSNGGMPGNEKKELLKEFVKTDRRKIFHLNRFPQKQEIFDFIAKTTNDVGKKKGKKRRKNSEVMIMPNKEGIVFGEDEKTSPN